MATSVIDSKGRLSIPADIREQLGLTPGDVMFFDVEDNVVRIAKASNPFDALAEEARAEHAAGDTISIDEFAKREGITLE